jgi:predicted DNA-binding antitoxin AbrB/MazE fold protein
MSQTIRAIYEDAVLRPLTPLALPERVEVQVRIETASDSPGIEIHRRAVDEALLAAGLMAPRAVDPAALRPLTDAERDALARHISAGRPLSEIIVEERGGR